MGLFGKKKAVEKQIAKMAPRMNSNNAPSRLSAEGASKMAMLAMRYDSTVQEFNNSGKAKRALQNLKQIEKDVKKTLK